MKNRNPDKGFLFFCALAFFPQPRRARYSICFSQNRTASSIQPSAFVPVPSPQPCLRWPSGSPDGSAAQTHDIQDPRSAWHVGNPYVRTRRKQSHLREQSPHKASRLCQESRTFCGRRVCCFSF